MFKNVASQIVGFQMVATADGSDVTSGTPTVYITGDGGTQSTGGGTSTHEGNGQWTYAPSQAETNFDHIIFTMVLANAVSQGVNVYPVVVGVGNRPAVDAEAVSGSTTAADNVEANIGNLDQSITSLDTVVDRIETDTQDLQTQIGTAGAGLTDLGGMSTAMKAEVNAEADTALSDYGANTTTPPTAAAIADAVWDESTTSHTTSGTFGEQVKTDIDAILADTNELQSDDIPGTLTTIEGKIDTVDTNVDAVLVDTVDIQSRLPAALVNSRMDCTIDATGMESGAVNNILATQMADVYAANGTAPTLQQGIMAIHQMLMDFGISGTSIAVRKVDGSAAFTVTLDSASAPTDASR